MSASSGHQPKILGGGDHMDAERSVLSASVLGAVADRTLPLRLRARLRRWYCELQGRDPLLPPSWLQNVGTNAEAEYTIIGDEFCGYLTKLCALRPTDRVLDVGCGSGRMARPLTRYLKRGSYDGVDIVRASIKWCQSVYTPFYPRFHFHVADIFNQMYNPTGRLTAATYRFPFDTAAFDVVFLASVFTHMLPPDLDGYFSEIVRVLAPDGRCMITYFLMSPESRKRILHGTSHYQFSHEREGCWIDNAELPEEAVAYDRETILERYRRSGLEIVSRIHEGQWSGHSSGLTWQDLIVARKPNPSVAL
jgi:SAM-dependent methyltransferase